METLKQKIKQKIMATLVMLFMMVMMFGSLNLSQTSAATTTTTLIQNFIGGALGHTTAATLGFNNIAIGTAINSLANLATTNVWDLRGTGAGWTVTGVCNNLTISNSAAGVNNVSNAAIAWNPTGGTIIAISGVTTGITLGTAQYLNGSRALATAAVGSGMGNYRVNNVVLNVVYNGRTDQLAGTYQATLTMTST